MNAGEAIANGFADQVDGNRRIAACAFDLGVFDRIPKDFIKQQTALDKRQLENALRDAGYSRKEAKELAIGPQREADTVDVTELAEVLKNNIAKFGGNK